MMIAEPVLAVPGNDHPTSILLAHLERGKWIALLFRFTTLDARVINSINLYLVNRFLNVAASSCEPDKLLNVSKGPVLRIGPVNIDAGIPEPDRRLHLVRTGRARGEGCR